MRKGKIGAVFVALLLVVIFIGVIVCAERIPAGYVGVIYNMNGGVNGEVLNQGWHLLAPSKKVTNYSVGTEQSYLTSTKDGDSTDDDSFEVPSSDGKGLTVDLTFTYHFDSERVTDTFIRFKGMSGAEIKNNFIKPNIMSWTKEVTAKYPVVEILGEERARLNIELTEYLKEKFAPYGIIIEGVSLINIDPDDATRDAIQKKVTAQQEKELAAIEAQTAQIQAQKDREVAEIQAQQDKAVAEINAEKKLIEAQANAEALKIAAEAEADANRKVAASLTPELIEKIKYEQWNGELSKVTGSNSIISIDGIN